MIHKPMKRKFPREVKKYYRWLRLYLKRVRDIEREIGGELQAC